MKKNLTVYFLPLIALAVWAADLVTKSMVVHRLAYARPVNVLGNFFRLTFVYNEGITFGMFRNANNGIAPFLLTAFACVAVAAVVYVYINAGKYLKPGNPVLLGRIALMFVVGGALGNITDRLFLFNNGTKAVVDFLDVGIGNVRWYTFNVADSFVVIGSIALAVLFIFFELKKGESGTDPVSPSK